MNLSFSFAATTRSSLLRSAARTALALAGLASSAVLASAGPISTYSGESIAITTSGPFLTAAGAAGSFSTAAALIGNVSTITFEGDTLGAFSALTVATGVSISGADLNGANQTIRNTSNSPSIPTLDGFNTTPGGSYFVEMQAGTLTFTFASPIDSFGAYFTGVQNFFFSTIAFSDGTSELISIPNTGTTNSIGAVDYVGFTDPGASITSITINAGSENQGADYIGVDDVSYGTLAVSATPEPGSIVLLLTGCLALGLLVWQRRAAEAL